MLKTSQVLVAFLMLLFVSCETKIGAAKACAAKFKTARELMYTNAKSMHQSSMDSAMHLLNECMQCDSIKKVVVDYKIRLFLSMKRYAEGLRFVDSLSEGDFTYSYQKSYISKLVRALQFEINKDTINRDLVFQEVADDMERYIEHRRSMDEKEFTEAYTELFVIKEKILDSTGINKEVETLKKKYPNKQYFFDSFKR